MAALRSSTLVLAVGVIALLLWKVVPVLGTMFSDFDSALPKLGFSAYLRMSMPMLLGVVAIVVAFRLLHTPNSTTPSGR